jgi:predicted SAM-dependent methyltransferase
MPVNGMEYLNAGCGKVRYPNCLNMDIADNEFTKVDVIGDVRAMPFENKSFKGVILAHVLEHMRKDDHKKVLLETRRVLEDGGQVYVEIPDLLLACKFFAENFKGRGNYWYQCIYGRDNYESDTHKSGLTEQYLTDILFDCGFGHLRWLNLDEREALIAVFADKLDELPGGKL